MSELLFSPREEKIPFYYIDSMQKAVNDVIDIFTDEGTENVTGYFLVKVKHSHLYNKLSYIYGLVLIYTCFIIL